MSVFQGFQILEGPHIEMKPLSPLDSDELFETLMSQTTWMVAERGITDKNTFNSYLEGFFARQNKGEGLTLVAREKLSGQITSMSTFWNPSTNLTKIEIGFTWVADRWMRTFVNTEQKYLMLKFAFESLKVKRVEFSVDPRNERSNAAMKRLGAHLEGTLRKWRFLSENDKGDRNIFSIIDDEWPSVRSRLEWRLNQG